MNPEELAERISAVDSRARSNTHRIDRLEERQDDLDKLTAVLAGQQKDIEHINTDVKEIKGDVKSLMEVPRSRWNAIVTSLATGAAGAILGALLALIFR